jgi:hypothetical protein
MSKQTFPRCFVIGVPTRDEWNELVEYCTRAGVSFTAAEGTYEGQYELCLLLVTDDLTAQIIGRAFGQKSILAIAENDRQAYDVDLKTGYHKALGKLEHIPDRDHVVGNNWVRVDGATYCARGYNKGADLPEGF